MEQVNRNMRDLGFANGWNDDSLESRLIEMTRKAGYNFKEVKHDVNGYDSVYECQEAALRYHICSN